MIYQYTKSSCNITKLTREMAALPIQDMEYTAPTLTIRTTRDFTSEEQTTAQDLVENHTTTDTYGIVSNTIQAAIVFGQQLIAEFATENVLLGITQAGMTNQVRKAASQVILALMTGSLYDAMAEARAIPVEDYDPTYITEARLLLFIHKIESYLGLPLSDDL